jgi:putative resolvase
MSEDKEYISIREASKISGMCPQTLRKLSDQKKLTSYRTLSGQRKFDKQSLEELCSATSSDENKKNFIYARITSEQDREALDRQIAYIRDADTKFFTYTVVTDVSTSMNFKRKGLSLLLDACINGSIGNVVITHKDRISRFAFDLVEQVVSKSGGKIIILHDGESSNDKELSEDLLTIARIYCKRK